MTSRNVRFAIEAAVVVVAAVVVGLAHLGQTADYAVVGGVWVAIAVVEYRLPRRRQR
jgi:hypothetical protein